MKIQDKYLKYGNELLDEKEILEVMLYASGHTKIKQVAESLLFKYGSLKVILSNNNLKLQNDELISIRFIVLKKLINEFFYKDYLKKLKKTKPILVNTKILKNFLRQQFVCETNEKFGIIYLSNNYEFLKYECLFNGTIDKAVVYIRTIVENVLMCNAKNIIIIHNHPSGIEVPSNDDINLTKKIKDGLNLLEIYLIDHILITEKGYFSFVEKGFL